MCGIKDELMHECVPYSSAVMMNVIDTRVHYGRKKKEMELLWISSQNDTKSFTFFGNGVATGAISNLFWSEDLNGCPSFSPVFSGEERTAKRPATT